MHESDMAPYVSLTAQRGLVVLLPPIKQQRAISGAISAIDDTIHSNQRLASLLDATIQVIFAQRVLGDGGPGWKDGNLTSIARFVNGRAFTKDGNGRARPILRIKELNAGLSDATLHSDIEAADDNIATHHDLLFAWSGSLDLYRWHGPESLINQHIFKVLADPGIPTWFVAEWLRHHMPEFQRIARDKATTMGHIKREHLVRAAVRVPPPAVLADLDATLTPLDAKVASLASETRRLNELRQLVLPRLVLGKTQVGNAPEASIAGTANTPVV